MKKIFDLDAPEDNSPVPQARKIFDLAERPEQNATPKKGDFHDSETTCRMCGKKLSLMQRISRQAFCTDQHKEAFQQQSNQFALEVLLGAKSPSPEDSQREATRAMAPESSESKAAETNRTAKAARSKVIKASASQPEKQPANPQVQQPDPPECGYLATGIDPVDEETAVALPDIQKVDDTYDFAANIPALALHVDTTVSVPEPPPPAVVGPQPISTAPISTTPTKSAPAKDQLRVELPTSIANLLAVTQTPSQFASRVRTISFTLPWTALTRVPTADGPAILPPPEGLDAAEPTLPLSLVASVGANGWLHCGRKIEIEIEPIAPQSQPVHEPAEISFSSGW